MILKDSYPSLFVDGVHCFYVQDKSSKIIQQHPGVNPNDTEAVIKWCKEQLGHLGIVRSCAQIPDANGGNRYIEICSQEIINEKQKR